MNTHLLALLLILPPPIASQDAASKPVLSLEAVAWMAGHWTGTEAGQVSEELWLPPAAGTMVGMWRWAQNDVPRLYELLAMSVEDGRLVLRLRHFRPDLHALEEKDAPFVLTAVSAGERQVVFEGNASDGGMLRIGYRSPAADRLEAFVERGGKKDEFTYRRK